ncbi:hypothetical protein OSB04_030136 [Centaurea solstitialis]|uniref:F-box domain-containing protein n=1 Tax=Centaurea solstitialis TaxID=347529 RepID=A0AA38S7V4_9ASTR|nr:hypothetical protein OSB04_030136 [Centaurea solstitialis]
MLCYPAIAAMRVINAQRPFYQVSIKGGEIGTKTPLELMFRAIQIMQLKKTHKRITEPYHSEMEEKTLIAYMVCWWRLNRHLVKWETESSSELKSGKMGMDSLPDDVVQNILSKLSNANDVASCNSVSNRWRKLLTSYRKRLCFSRDIFENLKPPQTPDSIMMQMVSSVSQLEQLVVSCRFTVEGLTSWLPVAGSSLKNLELRVAHPPTKVRRILECINQATARNLEYIKLWHVMMTRIPKLDVFHKLRCLEICEVIMEDSVLMEALRATPHLTRLVLLDCKGLSSVQIELPELRHCQLETCYTSGCSITLRAPKLQHLKVRGLAWIRVDDTNCLKTFSIVNYSCTAPVVELGDNLMALESLSANGYQWRWEDVTRMLQHATEVKHLSLDMRLIPGSTPIFPEIDFLDLFKTRPKLEFLHIHDVMIDALCNNHMTTTTPLKNRLVIPCLEEVVIILALPSNVGKVTWVVKSLLKYGTKLKKIKMIVNDFLTENHCLDRFCNEIPSVGNGVALIGLPVITESKL